MEKKFVIILIKVEDRGYDGITEEIVLVTGDTETAINFLKEKGAYIENARFGEYPIPVETKWLMESGPSYLYRWEQHIVV